MKIFFQIVCGEACSLYPLKTIEWYLVFTVAAILLAQLPNLNSIAGVSLIGAITAVAYCALIWIVSVLEGRLDHVSYEPPKGQSQVTRIFSVCNALGIIAFAFRGHNLVLEIQVITRKTLPCFIHLLIDKHFDFLQQPKSICCCHWSSLLQGTLRSDAKHPSRVAMWKGVMFAYLVIAICLFPLAIGGYWAYGNLVKCYISYMLNSLCF